MTGHLLVFSMVDVSDWDGVGDCWATADMTEVRVSAVNQALVLGVFIFIA
jgi:hypothetical protein